MGQKVNPKGLRLGIIETWQSKWFAGRDFSRYIGEDVKIRKFVKSKLQAAGISRVEIERAAARVKINIYTAKPGLVIGKKGKDIEDLRKELKDLVQRDVALSIIEARKPDMDAQLVAEGIAFQLERRVNFRRGMKEAINRAQRVGADASRSASQAA